MLIAKLKRFLYRNYVKVCKRFFPFLYAKESYYLRTGKRLDYNNPQNINEKLFWLHRYWQHPLIVRCADKIVVRDYVKDCGLGQLLTKIYKTYRNSDEINLSELPSRFVLKCNHGCGYVIICKDKDFFNVETAKRKIDQWLSETIGLETAEFHYQYIKPLAYAEEYIGDKNDERFEIQFFCFNGKAKHILLRNDLGDAAKKSFAISYTPDWQRVADRKIEDMSINIPRPKNLSTIIEYAERLAHPFPQVRVDFYLVEDKVYFGELTFTTHGNILENYTEETLDKWGNELILPEKLKTKWSKVYKSYKQ